VRLRADCDTPEPDHGPRQAALAGNGQEAREVIEGVAAH
jgi:hypothetical protein